MALVVGGAALESDGVVGGIVRSMCLLLLRGARTGEELLSTLIHFLQAHVAGNVYEFLKTVRFADYVKPICAIIHATVERLLALAREASQSIWSYHPAYLALDCFNGMSAKLKAFETQYYAFQTQLPAKMGEAAAWLQHKLDEILKIDPPTSGPMLATAGGNIEHYGIRAAGEGERIAAWPNNPLGVPPEVAMASRASEEASQVAN